MSSNFSLACISYTFIMYSISYLNCRRPYRLIVLVVTTDSIDFKRLSVSSANLRVVRTIKRAGSRGNGRRGVVHAVRDVEGRKEGRG